MTVLHRCFAFAVLFLTASSSTAADWIWTSAQPKAGETAWFRKSFELKDPGPRASLTITADNAYALYINGRLVGLQRLTDDWSQPDQYSIGSVLRTGKNAIAVRAINDEGPAAVMVDLLVQDGDREVRISSGSDWQARRNLQPRWSDVDAHGGGWQKPHVFGTVGQAAPWGKLLPPAAIRELIEQKQAQRRRTPFEFLDGDRVVLLGGTFIERAQRYGWLESALQMRFPRRHFTVRNLAWSADTVRAESRGIFDTPEVGYARMIEQVRELQPTVILLNYGSNDAFSGSAGLERFLAGYRRLIDDLSVTGASLVLISPAPLIRMPAPLPDPAAQNARLKLYSGAIQKLAAEQDLAFADLRKSADTLSLTAEHSDDGIHFNSAGYQVMSTALISAISAAGETVPAAQVPPRLRDLIIHKNELFFHSWRPQNITYLFLFRKHEQGQNAKEVEAFRPLVEKLESQISEVKQNTAVAPSSDR